MAIGIMSALVEEISYLLEKIEIRRKETFAEKSFYIGTIAKEEVILCHSGVGKVNAAMTTQILIDHFHVRSIMLTGTSGLLDTNLKTGDIVVSKDTVEHDVNFTHLGDKLGEIPGMSVYVYEANPLLKKIALQAGKGMKGIKVVEGRILSGDQFIASEDAKLNLRERFQGTAVEAEGAAVGHVCYLNKVPFVIIRVISDEADDTAPTDFRAHLEVVAVHSQLLILRILKGIAALKSKKRINNQSH
ncbi:5'-methylthioadenosine/adenosylhomocysteine nucleosidase [Pseudalkalibacillus sp. SCS-8]|uniref:5'-methylthioadenosine/adenosylhomocysteine nucleosidase n=1 Tax=Pseudalkalibacillus nanhaiensis TaxID=3115291 RepID=UPI0032DB1667